MNFGHGLNTYRKFNRNIENQAGFSRPSSTLARSGETFAEYQGQMLSLFAPSRAKGMMRERCQPHRDIVLALSVNRNLPS